MTNALSRQQLESEIFVPARDPRTKKIRNVSTLHNLNVGVVEKSANLTVSGESKFFGIAHLKGGAIGTLNYPDGSLAIVPGNGLSVTQRADGKIVVGTSNSTFEVDSLIDRICALEDGMNLVKSRSSGVGTAVEMNVTPSGVINGNNTKFELPSSPAPASSLMFFKNGQLLTSGSSADYTLASATVTLSSPPEPDDTLSALYAYYLPVKSYSINEPATLTFANGAGSITLLNTPNPPETLMLFMNGQLLSADDFSLSGKVVSLNSFLMDIEDSRFFATYTY
jgi:hypothetical protein